MLSTKRLGSLDTSFVQKTSHGDVAAITLKGSTWPTIGIEPKTPPESNVPILRTTSVFFPLSTRCGELRFFRCGEPGLAHNVLVELPPLVKLPPKELLDALPPAQAALPRAPLDMGRPLRFALGVA
mmetsp:Transcript_13384/g.25298  ORF Transcript_13384/g.25298 Transcript_13384/m.25298 type:complete len:126 (+) Transcript_13384:577-954(+)